MGYIIRFELDKERTNRAFQLKHLFRSVLKDGKTGGNPLIMLISVVASRCSVHLLN